jgi:glycosyltransferase involved in cell wall biosynthesis
MRSMTIAIPSYNRREPVTRLVAELVAQARGSLAEALEVVVVLDGSNDRSAEALQRLDSDIPVRVVLKPHNGLAATRNRLLDEAMGDIVFFIDDDMRPSEGLLSRHRAFHEVNAGSLLMGPCLYPPGWPAPLQHAVYWEEVRRLFGARLSVEQFQDISFANTSGPLQIFRAQGGFDEAISSYGPEDLELGYRLLEAGVSVRYDPDAIAWHHQQRAARETCRLAISEGENYVRLIVRHPDAAVAVPLQQPSRARNLLRGCCGTSSFRYKVVCRVIAALLTPLVARSSPGRRLMKWSMTAGLLSGLFAQDPSGRIAGRLFGRS